MNDQAILLVETLLEFIECSSSYNTKEDYDEAVRIFYKLPVVKHYLTPNKYRIME